MYHVDRFLDRCPVQRLPVLDKILSSTVSSSLSLSQSCCDLLETLVNEGFVESKYASQQLHAVIACSL